MLTQYIRVLKGESDGGDPESISLQDLSMENSEKETYLMNQKYLYVAQRFPFNNIFFLLGATKNAQTGSKIKIEYWNGADGWVEAKDVMDYTKGLQKSGLVQFSLDNKSSWGSIPETDSDDDESFIPEELVGLSISDCNWLRISFTGDAVDAATEIKCLTYAFTTTAKVNEIDAQAKDYLSAFSSTKTDWQDEILVGSELMIADMKSSGLLKTPGQIIILDDYILPCTWRVLEHIYYQLGASYDGKRGELKSKYKSFLAGPKTLDKDGDGKISKSENVTSSPRLRR